MAWLEAPVVVALLWIVAGLLLAWILIPAVGFALGLTRLDAEVIEDPSAPEPRQADPGYGGMIRAFTELGFHPVGRVIESARFFSPLQLRWRSQGENWLVAKDGQTFVAIFKPRGRDAWMAAAKTSFVGGGYVSTVTSRAGLQLLSGEQWRVEVGDVEPRELIAEHRQNVDEFAREHGVAPRAATFREAVDAGMALSRRVFPRAKLAMSIYPMFLLFAVMLYRMSWRQGGTVWFRPLSLCFVGLIFAGLRFMAVPSRVPNFVRAAVMVGILAVPALVWTRLPHSSGALSSALDRLDAEAQAGHGAEAVARITAVGSRACRQVIGRYARADSPETRARLHEVLVKLNGGSDLSSGVTDVPQAAEIWGRWCKDVYSKG